jgi:hypothetical protein
LRDRPPLPLDLQDKKGGAGDGGERWGEVRLGGGSAGILRYRF